MSELDISIEARLEIGAAEAWSYFVEHYFENHASWDPAIVKMEKLTADAVGVGTRGKETRKAFGKQTTEFEVTACEPAKRFAFRNTTGPFELEREYSFTDEGTTTTLKFHFRMKPRGPMKLIFPLLRRVVEKQVRTNMARIPAVIRRRA